MVRQNHRLVVAEPGRVQGRAPLPVEGQAVVRRLRCVADGRTAAAGNIGVHRHGLSVEEDLVKQIVRIESRDPAPMRQIRRVEARRRSRRGRDAGMRNQKEVFTMRTGRKSVLRLRQQDPKGTKARSDQPARSPSAAGPVFRSKGRLGVSIKTGKVWPSHTVARQFQDARKDAGLPDDLVLYCARHGFGTEMYRATKNLLSNLFLPNFDEILITTNIGYAACHNPNLYRHDNGTGDVGASLGEFEIPCVPLSRRSFLREHKVW
jgi:hypothetical protein